MDCASRVMRVIWRCNSAVASDICWPSTMRTLSDQSKCASQLRERPSSGAFAMAKYLSASKILVSRSPGWCKCRNDATALHKIGVAVCGTTGTGTGHSATWNFFFGVQLAHMTQCGIQLLINMLAILLLQTQQVVDTVDVINQQ